MRRASLLWLALALSSTGAGAATVHGIDLKDQIKLLQTWLGKKPPNESLKQGLLGN